MLDDGISSRSASADASVIEQDTVVSDEALIAAVRGGDLEAYGTLFERHVQAARRLARQLVPVDDAEDLVSEAFSRVMGVLQRGGGPDVAFRAYLLSSLRRLQVDRLKAAARLQPTDDMTKFDAGVAFEDTVVSGFENEAAARAFASLPERWQQVLWHTEVEGQKPVDIAPLLGMTPNSVAALAYRAREGLRQAFVTAHAQDEPPNKRCAWTRAQLGAFVRDGASHRDVAKVKEHLRGCRECSSIAAELAEINSNLGAVLAPIVLGTAGAGYLAASHLGLGGVKAGLFLLLDRGRHWMLQTPVGRTTGGGVAAAAVVAAATFTPQVGLIHDLPQPSGGGATTGRVQPSAVTETADVTRPRAASSPSAKATPTKPPGATASDLPFASLLPSGAASSLPVIDGAIGGDGADVSVGGSKGLGVGVSRSGATVGLGGSNGVTASAGAGGVDLGVGGPSGAGVSLGPSGASIGVGGASGVGVGLSSAGASVGLAGIGVTIGGDGVSLTQPSADPVGGLLGGLNP